MKLSRIICALLTGALCSMTAAAEPWTLERALAYVQERSPDARIARQRVATARASLEEANAVFWPRLQFQSGYMRTDNPMLTFGSILNQRAYSPGLDFNNVPDIDNLNLKGTLTAPVYTGGRIRAQQAAARANTQSARARSEAIRNELSYEVVRGFQYVMKSRKNVEAATAAVQSHEHNAVLARRRLDSGNLLKSELLEIEVRLSEAREDLVRARNALNLGQRSLRALLGIELQEFIVAESIPDPVLPKGEEPGVRAELVAAELLQDAASQTYRAARAGYLPQVSLFGSLDYDYGTRTDQDGGSYTAGALLQWDIWDGWLTRSRVRQASANVELVREQRRKLQSALTLELERARLDFQAAEERLIPAGQAVAQAEENVRLTRTRFEEGAALATQLVNAETALVSARVRRAEAEADRNIAVAALRKSLALPQIEERPSNQ